LEPITTITINADSILIYGTEASQLLASDFQVLMAPTTTMHAGCDRHRVQDFGCN
jgi:hypothetical protein